MLSADYLTSTDPEDAEMRKKAPYMLAWGVFMVLMQAVGAAGIALGSITPPCLNNHQCLKGQFCNIRHGDTSGRCIFCGEGAPLVRYWVTTDPPEETGGGPDGKSKQWNFIETGHYPKVGMYKRSDTPTKFAGFNLSMVEERCVPPFADFSYDVNGVDREYGNGIPNWLPSEQVDGNGKLGDVAGNMPQQSVGNWCDSCVFANGDVDIFNEKLGAQATVGAMRIMDWGAFFIASYVLGLNAVSEVKDVLLCELHISRNPNQLNQVYKIVFTLLNRFRIHVFLGFTLLSASLVVLTRGVAAHPKCLRFNDAPCTKVMLFSLCQLRQICRWWCLGSMLQYHGQ